MDTFLNIQFSDENIYLGCSTSQRLDSNVRSIGMVSSCALSTAMGHLTRLKDQLRRIKRIVLLMLYPFDAAK